MSAAKVGGKTTSVFMEYLSRLCCFYHIELLPTCLVFPTPPSYCRSVERYFLLRIEFLRLNAEYCFPITLGCGEILSLSPVLDASPPVSGARNPECIAHGAYCVNIRQNKCKSWPCDKKWSRRWGTVMEEATLVRERASIHSCKGEITSNYGSYMLQVLANVSSY